MDIICAKCGKHFSSIEAAREHRGHCKKTSEGESIHWIPAPKSKITPEEWENLMKSINPQDVSLTTTPSHLEPTAIESTSSEDSAEPDVAVPPTSPEKSKGTPYKKEAVKNKREKTINYKIKNWQIALLFIFALCITGLGVSTFIGNIIPLWLLFGFSFIFSIEKWFYYFTRKYKALGKLYRLLLNLSILSLLGLIVWSGIKLFSQQFVHSQLIGSFLFLAELALFFWVWRVVSKNSWRWPSMKLTVFSLMCLFVIFAFAGVQPFTQYKDSFVSTLTSWGKSQQSNVQEKESPPVDNPASANNPNIITDKILNPQWWSGTDQDSIIKRSQELFELTNEARANNGLSPLKRNTQLDKLAQGKAESMHNTKAEMSISHSGFDERAKIANSYGFNLVAENIAYGGFEASSFDEMWMSSPGHKANILDRELTHVGIGVYGKYAVQLFGGY